MSTKLIVYKSTQISKLKYNLIEKRKFFIKTYNKKNYSFLRYKPEVENFLISLVDLLCKTILRTELLKNSILIN